MSESHAYPRTRAGDLTQLVGPRRKVFFVTLQPGETLHTNYGYLEHDSLIDQIWGSEVFSHSGNRFLVLQPRLGDLLLKIPRRTQIMYPKDIGFLIVHLGIGPGQRVAEAGTGSGALTTALAYFIGKEGHVYSYDTRAEMQDLARENLQRLNLDCQVTFSNVDIQNGFHETDLDAVFLDLPDPENYIDQIRAALKPGGTVGVILPTANQVSAMINSLEKGAFDCIEVCEILYRAYKPVSRRLRPKDRMVGHTGYLITARPIIRWTRPSTE